jgi:hypothetical protein
MWMERPIRGYGSLSGILSTGRFWKIVSHRGDYLTDKSPR